MAFKWMFAQGLLIHWTSWLIWFSRVKVMSAIIKFIEKKEDPDMMWGSALIGFLLFSIVVEHYLDEHGWSTNVRCGFAFQ